MDVTVATQCGPPATAHYSHASLHWDVDQTGALVLADQHILDSQHHKAQGSIHAWDMDGQGD